MKEKLLAKLYGSLKLSEEMEWKYIFLGGTVYFLPHKQKFILLIAKIQNVSVFVW